MLEVSAVATAIPSLWSAVNSWFTPTVLFLLLNLMIAAIALISSLTPTSPPSHDDHIHSYPHELQQHEEHVGRGGPSPASAAAKQSPSVSLIVRVKSSLGLFSSSPGKSSPQQPPPLIPPEDLYRESDASPKDPFEKQGLGEHGSPSPVGKFDAFDLYGYLPGEPASEIPRESNPAHYIFEPTHPQEVLLPAERDEKVEEEGEVEDEDVDEKEESESESEGEEEAREGNGSEEEREPETETEVQNLLLQRGFRRSESLNVKSSFSSVGEEEGRGGVGLDAGDVAESVEKRRPATAREGKGKWGAGGDEEVDARADDFINRFKQQLKLQRMDSLARLKDAATTTTISKVRSF